MPLIGLEDGQVVPGPSPTVLLRLAAKESVLMLARLLLVFAFLAAAAGSVRADGVEVRNVAVVRG